jgi:hypothetical protein
MRIAGRTFGRAEARLLVLPAIAAAGCVVWLLLPGPSDAESPSVGGSSAVIRVTQNAAGPDEGGAPTQAILASPSTTTAPPEIAVPETTPPAKPPVDGLKISSQSWRRGGLGSKALVTFTLRNRNDYAVKDIEIVCAFARRDGSHLTDRRRVISDTVNMKSRKRYSGLLVGFVNVYANKAKCSLVTASRI